MNNNNSFADVIKNAATGFDVLSPGGLGRLAQRRQDAGLDQPKKGAVYGPYMSDVITPKNKAASLFEELFGKLAGNTGNSSASKESAAITRLKANLATLQTAYTDAAKAIKESMQSFQSEATSGFGLISNGDVQYFSVEKLISTMKRVKDAAANFATNIAKLKKKGATASLIDQIVGLGAEQGGTVAEGLLKSGKLSTVLKLYKGVGKLGTSVGTAQAKIDNGATQSQLKTAIDKLSGSIAKGGSTYNIKVTKSDASAVDIITAIRKYERTSGRNYLVN